jgi:hypothetical protein
MPSSARREQEATVTESDWLTSTDPLAMLAFLRDRGPVSERKLRLFAVACCRLIWPLIDDATSRRAVEVAERFADGLVTDQELAAFSGGRYREATTLTPALSSATAAAGWSVVRRMSEEEAGLSARHASDATYYHVTNTPAYRRTRHNFEQLLGGFVAACGREQSDSLRDILGDPFRAVVVSPEWRTEAVVALACGVYEERAFERLPVLADALEDAGCADEAVLAHCRGPGPHVRGCWVVDAVLDKV